jgi:osmotically inducible protein OsmC
MPIANREAQIVSEGPLASGAGTLSSGSRALDRLPVTWASRTESPDGKTSPEELIAAAHARRRPPRAGVDGPCVCTVCRDA